MDLRQFWATWRRDIMRGAMLFTVILIAGLTINSLVGRVRRGFPFNIESLIRPELAGPPGSPNPPGPPRPPAPGDTAALWTWTGKVAPKQWVRIRNVNGDVEVEPAVGDSVVVVAEKSGQRSHRGAVRLVAVPGDGVTICALWQNGRSHCGAQADYETGGLRHHPVRVQFTVRLPRGVKVDALTVNGNVTVAGASAPVKAQTVNGQIDVRTSAGPLEATNVNGSVRAAISGFAEPGKVEVKTMKGAVTLELPARLNANLEATTVVGSVDTDFPLTASEGIVPRRFTATVGTGGRAIRVETLYGSIRVRKIAP
jgi:putative adhesin